MVRQKVVIKNPTGLHLRPAGNLCKEAIKYKSLITFTFRDSTANAKSVLSVLGACVKCGDEIELICDGPDEEEALTALTEAIEGGLGSKLQVQQKNFVEQDCFLSGTGLFREEIRRGGQTWSRFSGWVFFMTIECSQSVHSIV